MDPNVALATIRRELDLASKATSLARANVHRENAATTFQVLDTWISHGGYFPSEWIEAQRRALENVRRPSESGCQETTLAGTTIPVPCPPSVDELQHELRPVGRWGREPAAEA